MGVDEDVLELFEKRLTGFVEEWPLNQARANIMAQAMRNIANELENGEHNSSNSGEE